MARCLELPSLSDAVLLSGRTSLNNEIQWVSVIESAGKDFVSPGELVLTTGLGTNDSRLADFVHYAGEADVAAVGLSVGDGAPHRRTPDRAFAAANDSGVVLLEIPWRTRFSDITRSVLSLLCTPDSASPIASADLPAVFSDALLDGNGGPAAVVFALKQSTGLDGMHLIPLSDWRQHVAPVGGQTSENCRRRRRRPR